MIYPYQRNGRQEDMVVDTRPVRRIGKRANQVKSGKQPNGTLFPLAMSPPTLRVCYRNVRMGLAHSKEEAGGLDVHLGH